ncbi:hypothetical protein Vadar_018966 [Vaccinium darrowii]|uniref:Uncharacterized protein n=1 Tax=Vaccinium darrowii TaxID=229202 RepID=A0ACB7Y0J2_9ERIC|nr:hypothetical protein Vadar_018966 [Vaccinium darrowii]
MVKLRHLYTKRGKFTFNHSSKEVGRTWFDRSAKLDSLKTLHRICACEACRTLLVRTPNLWKLGLHGEMIPEHNVLRFPDLEYFECLNKLTLSASFAFESTVESTLYQGLKLPQTITRITLKYTRLKWEELLFLQNLPWLEVLRLIKHACCGPVWDVNELKGFPQLKYLKFDDLDIKEWIASEVQFLKLEVLVLQNCRKLEQIPSDFGYLNELHEIKLVDCRRSAEESARKIQGEQAVRKGDDDCLNLLAIYNSWR